MSQITISKQVYFKIFNIVIGNYQLYHIMRLIITNNNIKLIGRTWHVSHLLSPFICNPLSSNLFPPFIRNPPSLMWHRAITPPTQFHALTGLMYTHTGFINQNHISRLGSKPCQNQYLSITEYSGTMDPYSPLTLYHVYQSK